MRKAVEGGEKGTEPFSAVMGGEAIEGVGHQVLSSYCKKP
jgi:hypothetical protein